MRADISAALDRMPGGVRDELLSGPAREPLLMLDEYLPAGEAVSQLASVAPKVTGSASRNCVLALTDRRLIFVAPLPQVLSWNLVDLDQVVHISMGLHIGVGGSTITLPIDGTWGKTLRDHINVAVAIARLAGG
jgi:hypothetical protein